MGIDRAFSLALVLSLIWHVAIGTIFVIKVFPSAAPRIHFSEINFLGPLLIDMSARNKVSYFGNTLSRQKEAMQNHMIERNHITVPLSVPMPLEKISKIAPQEAWNVPHIEGIHIRVKELPQIRKQSLFFLSEEKKQVYKPAGIELAGPISRQEIIFQPQLPHSFRWDLPSDKKQDMDAFSVTIRFKVSREGLLESVEELSSCGYSEIDLLGIQYLRMLKFAPLSDREQEDERWGKLKLYINRY